MYQLIFNWLVGSLGTLVAAVSIVMWTEIKELKRDMFARVHKDDYRNDVAEIKQMLTRIFDKLETKQDR